MHLLEVERLSYRVDSKRLLEEVSFTLEEDEILAVIGPSGAGKSTLLRQLNRLADPSEGNRFFRGKPYEAWPIRELRRRIALAAQQGSLFPGSVADNVCAGPQLRGQPCDAAALLQACDLPADFASRDVADLSGGERQRVVLARTLANDPDVLLLDEPTGALDPGARGQIGDLIASLARQRHCGVIWVTHLLEEAERYADRVLLLVHGRVVAQGSAATVLPQAAQYFPSTSVHPANDAPAGKPLKEVDASS
ncbi:MAG: ATP-binding cassette domain-containing protein [Firmicutes bacterium]|nr:ATP-binding cassette domain-containing protein [Bacillota bacterium]